MIECPVDAVKKAFSIHLAICIGKLGADIVWAFFRSGVVAGKHSEMISEEFCHDQVNLR